MKKAFVLFTIALLAVLYASMWGAFHMGTRAGIEAGIRAGRLQAFYEARRGECGTDMECFTLYGEDVSLDGE